MWVLLVHPKTVGLLFYLVLLSVYTRCRDCCEAALSHSVKEPRCPAGSRPAAAAAEYARGVGCSWRLSAAPGPGTRTTLQTSCSPSYRISCRTSFSTSIQVGIDSPLPSVQSTKHPRPCRGSPSASAP